MRALLVLLLLFAFFAGFAQTQHPLLLQMQKKAASAPFGSYRLVVKEHYRNQRDTSRFFARCAFLRYAKPDDSPGLRFELDVEGHAGESVQQQRIVFDGVEKFEFRGDTLLMLYDTRELGESFVLRGLHHYFFVPLLLHDAPVRRFLGPDSYWGTPPYRTLADTLIGATPCRVVQAEWAPDSNDVAIQRLTFFLDKKTGLARRFVYLEWTDKGPKAPVFMHYFEIDVAETSLQLPYNSFYIDWPSLAPTWMVKRYHDCQYKELLRGREEQPGL